MQELLEWLEHLEDGHQQSKVRYSLKGSLYESVREYFFDAEFLRRIKEKGSYKKTSEKAHSQLEIREYYQTEDIKRLEQRGAWKGLKSIIMERKTLIKGKAGRVPLFY